MEKIVWIIRIVISFVLAVILEVSVVLDQEQVRIVDLLAIPVMVVIITPLVLVAITIGQYVLMWIFLSPAKDLWEPKK